MRQKKVDGLDFGHLNKFGVPSWFTQIYKNAFLHTPWFPSSQAAEGGVDDEGGMVEEEGDAGWGVARGRKRWGDAESWEDGKARNTNGWNPKIDGL